MNRSLTLALGAVLAVGVLAWVLRRMSPEASDTMSAAPPPPDPDDLGPEWADDDDASAEVVAITSDGWAFLPRGDAVHLVPPGDPEDLIPVRSTEATGYQPQTDPDIQILAGRGAPVNPRTRRPVSGWSPGEHLTPGEIVGARVCRGAPDHDPWRLEALGRDGDYRAWRFETEESARVALDLITSRIVRPPLDEEGEPRQPGDEEFARAKAEQDALEAELAMGSEPDDEPESRWR